MVMVLRLMAQINYYVKDIRMILSARYEELVLNDLVVGSARRFSPAIGYKLKGSNNAMVKFQYFNILRDESIDPQTWKEQFRLGFQFQLK